MDGFDAVHKQYLVTCLRMRSTPEVYNIGSKRMCVDSMANKGKVRFARGCKHLLDLCDEVGAKGDKNM